MAWKSRVNLNDVSICAHIGGRSALEIRLLTIKICLKKKKKKKKKKKGNHESTVCKLQYVERGEGGGRGEIGSRRYYLLRKIPRQKDLSNSITIAKIKLKEGAGLPVSIETGNAVLCGKEDVDPTEPPPYREKGKDVPWLARDGGMIAQADITVKLIRLLNQLFLPFLFPGATCLSLRERSVRWPMILRPGPDPA
ncbi:hypothetical protein B296_00058354 [Ensete ventricosum]|uniref:Uncharacterized protein n=1 Tax=Ensete ventricosum TaxID=4639 RepID=A0A426XIE6_ENSVE|nr:hypothetical protein B296_00058354 [Ensete ventricosum]